MCVVGGYLMALSAHTTQPHLLLYDAATLFELYRVRVALPSPTATILDFECLDVGEFAELAAADGASEVRLVLKVLDETHADANAGGGDDDERQAEAGHRDDESVRRRGRATRFLLCRLGNIGGGGDGAAAAPLYSAECAPSTVFLPHSTMTTTAAPTATTTLGVGGGESANNVLYVEPFPASRCARFSLNLQA